MSTNNTPEQQLDWWKKFFLMPDDQKDHEAAHYYAAHWDSCACCALLPNRRRRDGSYTELGQLNVMTCPPLNRRLDAKGCAFVGLVSLRDWPEAERVFQEIQELVREENAVETVI